MVKSSFINVWKVPHGEIPEQVFRQRIFVLGIALVVFGGGALGASSWLGRVLYKHVSQLPSIIGEKIYADHYSLEDYSEQFFEWVLWPAGVFIGIGLLSVVYFFLPIDTRGFFFPLRWPIGIGIIALLGALVRARAYFQSRSLWLDEAFLALNIRERALGDLLAVPLDYGQSAPPGFLILVLAVTSLLGVSDLSLRLVPFVFGLALIVVSLPLAFRLFSSNLARLIFVGFLSFSPVLVYYSHEFKQYSMDAFVTVMVLWIWAHRERWGTSWGLGVLGFFGVLLSLTAVFSLTALGLVMFGKIIAESKNWKVVFREISPDLPVYFWWLTGGLIHLWYLAIAGTDRESMENWWSANGGFPPTGNFLETIRWTFSSLSQLVWLAVGHPGRAGPGMGDGVPLLAFTLFVATLFVLRRNARKLIFPTVLILVALGAAYAGFYPFSSRLNIYLVPIVVLFIASLAEKSERGSRSSRSLLLTLPAVMAVVPVVIGFYLLGKPFDNWDMRWLIQEVRLASNPGDILVAVDQALIDWYLPGTLATESGFVALGNLEDAITLSPEAPVWVVSTHSSVEGVAGAISESHQFYCRYDISGSSLDLYVPQALPDAVDFDCRPQVNKF